MKSDKVRQLATFYSLSGKQQKVIVMLFEGVMTQEQIADDVGVARTTISAWKKREQFCQARDEYSQYMLRSLTGEAVLTMKRLLNARSEMVQFSAAKDILDRSLSNAQSRKISAEAKIAEAKLGEIRKGHGTGEVTVNLIRSDRREPDGNQRESG